MTNVVLFTISSEVLKNPQYAIFSDCRTLIGCNPIDLFVQPNSVYWIAVTDRDSAIGTFSIDMNPLNSTDNCVNQQRLTVIKTSMGSDLEGPYKPCEEITFRYSTNFLKLGAQWLHSIFPVLSPCLGYSISQEPDSVSLPESSIAHWAWYPAGTVFWKSIDNSGNLIGVDSTGRLCMLGVPGCNPMIGGGNCSISGTSMPGGWIGWSPGSNCADSGTDPNKKYGDPQSGPWVVKFSVKIPCTSCDSVACNDYTVGVTAFADGQTGGWESSSCNGHGIVSKKLSVKCCQGPSLQVQNATVCSGQTYSMIPQIAPAGSKYFWSVVDSLGTSGAVKGDSSVFVQTIVNHQKEPVDVKFKFVSYGPDGCPGDPVFMTLTVLPELRTGLDENIESCTETPLILHGKATGGVGKIDYNWSTGENTADIQVMPVQTTSYTLTLNDSAGCQLTQTVNVIIGSKLQADIISDTLAFCFADRQQQTLEASSNAVHLPVSYEWHTGWGERAGASIPIEAANPGNYTVVVEVSDATGCVGYDTALVSIFPDPDLIFINEPKEDICKGDSVMLRTVPVLSEAVTLNSVPEGAVNSSGLILTDSMEVGIDYEIFATFTNENGCSGHDSIIVRVKDCSAGNTTNDYSAQLHLYPNPVNQQLNIATQLDFEEMLIIDPQGRIIYQGPFRRNIDAVEFAPGVYLIKLTSHIGYANQKFVKLH